MKRQIKIMLTFFLLLTFGSLFSISAQSLNLIHDKTFDVTPGQLLEVQTDVGDIKLRTWDRDEVHIRVYGDRDAEEEVDFYFEKTSKGVLVDAEKESSWSSWFGGIRLKYEIDVPQNFNLDMKTAGGDMTVVDLDGEVQLRTSGGDIICDKVNGDLKASTSGGDVQLTKVNGTITASTSGGDVEIRSSNGKVDASTSGGDITLDYEGENQGVELRTSGGDIDVRIPDNFKAEVYLKTSGGSIRYHAEARVEETSKYKFVGTMNGGGPELNAKTSGGDVSVETY